MVCPRKTAPLWHTLYLIILLNVVQFKQNLQERILNYSEFFADTELAVILQTFVRNFAS